MKPIDIISTNFSKRLALLSDGRAVPITNLFDRDGEETDDVTLAVSFVAGEGADWLSDLVENFEQVTLQ